MHVVIVGAGEVGSYVARILVEEGHEVAVIEQDERRARRLDATLNALVVQGSGINPAALLQARIEHADLLLAVTAVDEVNLIACMTARKYAGEKLRAVARVRQSSKTAGGIALSAEDLGLDALVSPHQAVATSAIQALRYPGSGEMRELAGGRLALVGTVLAPESPLVQDTLAGIRREFARDLVVIGTHGPEGFRIPGDADRLRPDQRVFLLAHTHYLTELAILSGRPWYQARRVLIVGCGNTGLAVARELERLDLAPTVLEKDAERAERVAALLPNSIVLHGDGSDPELLRDKIEEARIDAVLVLLSEAEKSVLIGIFAKSLGARKVVARCDQPAYVPLANRLGIDAVISPKRAMTAAILRYVRKGDVEWTMLFGEHEAELIELGIGDEPARSLVDRPLGEIELPEGALVGAVMRGDQVLLASNDVVLRPGDELIVACRRDALRRVEKLFG
jgi:trk system potassium uptake protein TrkA